MSPQYSLCFFVSLVCVGLWSACTSSPETATDKTSLEELATTSITLPYELLLEPSVLRSKTEITVPNDLVLKGEQQYQAFSLRGTLAPILAQIADTTKLELIFVCSDGYEANMKLSTALSHEGYIAFGGWPKSEDAKFAPYYLVWTDTNAHQNKKLVWPFAVISIRLSNLQNEFKAALPNDESLYAGFELFKQHCIKCHGINKAGGNMGPEFNYPKSITEYWQKEDVWAFIQAPQSYRYSSQMPPQVGLNRDDFEQIYAYLQGMKGHHPPS
ncbi:MAG: cytochrome c [Bacteroidia bacterium]